MSDTLHEDLSVFVLLKIVGNILQLDNNGKLTHCCYSLTTLNTFILLMATCRSITIKRGCVVAFRRYNVYANAPQSCFILRCPS
jgi:hypothetical protein